MDLGTSRRISHVNNLTDNMYVIYTHCTLELKDAGINQLIHNLAFYSFLIELQQ
jgi:hypothetical protein